VGHDTSAPLLTQQRPLLVKMLLSGSSRIKRQPNSLEMNMLILAGFGEYRFPSLLSQYHLGSEKDHPALTKL
jgi:hypothetical protein